MQNFRIFPKDMKTERENRFSDEQVYYLMALTRVPRLGSISVKKLLQHFGTPSAVFEQSLADLEAVAGSVLARNIKAFDRFDVVDKELEFIRKNNIRIVDFTHPDYPFRLRHTPDGPAVLFVQGELPQGPRPCIAVVGTRKMTGYGRMFIDRFLKDLQEYSPVIVSGLAYGVDVEAHRKAMEYGMPTIAVMGTSFRKIYPPVHWREYEMILDSGGAVISETWSDENTDPNFFLRRNRIVAGMTEATVVVESAAKGGALTTAEMALSYNRDVFAVPGRVNDTYSEGCNRLIATDKARILLSAADLIANLNWPSRQAARPVQRQLFPELDDLEKRIYEYLLNQGPEHADLLAVQLELPVSELNRALLMLELKGVISALPGNRYEAH